MYVDFADPQDEYKKDPNLKKEEVSQLEEWARKQAHLPKIPEMRLIQFLHSRLYNIEATKKSIEIYYTSRTDNPEFFSNRDPSSEQVQSALTTSLITILPARTEDDYPILLTKLVDLLPEKYDLVEAFKVIDMIISLTQMQIGTTPGQVMVMDAKDFSWGHLLRCNIHSLRKYLFFIQEALPVRLRAIHVVNISPITEKFCSLVRPFLKKNHHQVYFHKTVEGLDGVIPKEALPLEMGGTAGTCKELQEKIKRTLMDHHQYFLDEEKELVDQSKRIGGTFTSKEIFGIQGNFKKLDID